jgi:hypothetical protein
MFNRLLACSLRVVITGLIALVAAVALVTGYSGFMYLVRVHVREAVWLIGVAVISGGIAALLASRRGDLADC